MGVEVFFKYRAGESWGRRSLVMNAGDRSPQAHVERLAAIKAKELIARERHIPLDLITVELIEVSR